MWLLLFLAAISLHLPTEAAGKPDKYDAKDFENCGKSPASKDRMMSLLDNSTFLSENIKKIFGGEAVAVGEMPWICRIAVKSKSFGRTRFCTGALISSKYVLTAAHCLRPFHKDASNTDCLKHETIKKSGIDIVVNVGATNLKEGSSKEQKGEERKGVKKFMDEKWYEGNCITNDVAILELDKKVSGDKYPPICLLHRDKAATEMGEREHIADNAFISGFGNNPQTNRVLLQKVMIAPILPGTCRGHRYSFTRVPGKGSGEGDSGTPLAVLLNGRYYAYGVLGRSDECEKLPKGEPSKTIYERMSPRMNELRKIIYQ